MDLIHGNIFYKEWKLCSCIDIYTTVLNILTNFAKLLCGDVAIGMFTFGQHIELEFCPTCFRTNDYQTYINEVTTRIRSAHYHNSLTYTGEMAKCLRQHILPSPGQEDTDCVLMKRPTIALVVEHSHLNSMPQNTSR